MARKHYPSISITPDQKEKIPVIINGKEFSLKEFNARVPKKERKTHPDYIEFWRQMHARRDEAFERKRKECAAGLRTWAPGNDSLREVAKKQKLSVTRSKQALIETIETAEEIKTLVKAKLPREAVTKLKNGEELTKEDLQSINLDELTKIGNLLIQQTKVQTVALHGIVHSMPKQRGPNKDKEDPIYNFDAVKAKPIKTTKDAVIYLNNMQDDTDFLSNLK